MATGLPQGALDALLADLAAEHDAFARLVRSLPPGSGGRPTAVPGWAVTDVVAHLVVAERAVTASVLHGVDPSPTGSGDTPPGSTSTPADADVEPALQTWERAAASARAALAGAPAGARHPWGGRTLSIPALATARIMETWAHGLDVARVVGDDPPDTARLVHVAWLGHRTLPHAFALAGEEPPADPAALRLELAGPDGSTWTFGPQGSPHRIVGAAGDWCRVAVRRPRPDRPVALEPEGVLAAAALRVVRAYL
jgi:uncharacterized protein (TIGR03084 family)